MKIIHQGKPPIENYYHGKCHTCQSIIQFERREARVVHDARDGDYVEILCPVCQDTDIKPPPMIRVALYQTIRPEDIKK